MVLSLGSGLASRSQRHARDGPFATAPEHTTAAAGRNALLTAAARARRASTIDAPRPASPYRLSETTCAHKSSTISGEADRAGTRDGLSGGNIGVRTQSKRLL